MPSLRHGEATLDRNPDGGVGRSEGQGGVMMLARSVRWAIGALVLCAAGPAAAQANLDQGKTAAAGPAAHSTKEIGRAHV